MFNGALGGMLWHALLLLTEAVSIVVILSVRPVKANVAYHLLRPGGVRVRNANLNQTCCVIAAEGQGDA